MSSFKSETETGVKSSFSNLAKIAGLAFGGAAVGALIKSSVESAAASQAISNSVRSEFGKMGSAVLDFANKQGAAFGSLETNTNQTSFALGKLFRNSGIGAQQAAAMTTNWEKLGLALNEAKGGGVAGAATALQELQTVAAGTSTRGLHDLGITITTAQVAAKAAADGFIRLGQSASGLTPAQKQLVTFQLAMRSLPDALRQAAANSHSFAAEQARLAVAWDNAKTALGQAFIPELTKGATALTAWLNRMERSGRLQHDFNQIASITGSVISAIRGAVEGAIHVWEGFANAVGGAKHALILLAGAYGLFKVGAIGKAVTNDANSIGNRIGTTFTNIRNRAKASSAAVANDFSSASRRVISQTNAMKQAGDKWSVQMSSNASKVKQSTGSVGSSFGALDTAMKQTSQKAKVNVGAMNQAFNDFANNTKTQATGFRGAITKASSGAATAFESAATGMKAAAIEVGATIKVAIIQTGIGLLVVAIGIAVGYIITHWDTVKRYTIALGAVMTSVWHGVTGVIIGYYKLLGGAFLHYIVGPITDFFGKLAHYAAGILSFFGFGGVADKLNALSAALGSVGREGSNLINSGISSLKQAKDAFGNVGKAWSDSLAKSANDPKVTDTSKKVGKKMGTDIATTAGQTIVAQMPSVQKAISDALANATAAANKAIATAVQNAKNNLDKIGQDLAKTIDQIQQKIGGAVGAVAGSPQGAAFEKLKKLIESGAPAFEIQKAQAELAGNLKNVGQTQKQQVSSQLANLTAAFDKGQIGYREFERRLHKILRDDGITMAQALKAGGPAFADAFKAQVDALGRQARAIAALPAKYRGIGGAGGAADIKIIQPLQVIKQEQLKVRTAVEKAAQAAHKQREAILKNQQKQIALAQAARSIGDRAVFRHSGNQPHPDHQRSAQFLSQIRDHTRRTADALTHAHPRPKSNLDAQIAKLTTTVDRLLSRSREPHAPSSIQAQLQAAQAELRALKGERAARTASPTRTLASAPQSHTAEIARSVTGAFGRVTHLLDLLRSNETRIGENQARRAETQIRLLDRIAGLLRNTRHERPQVALGSLTTPLSQLQTSNVAIRGAIQSQHAALLRGLREVCTDITAADKDIVAAELGLVSPIESLRRTELRIGDHAAQQRERQIRLARETNTLLRKLDKAKGVPGFNKERPGTGSKHARKAALAGVRV